MSREKCNYFLCTEENSSSIVRSTARFSIIRFSTSSPTPLRNQFPYQTSLLVLFSYTEKQNILVICTRRIIYGKRRHSPRHRVFFSMGWGHYEFVSFMLFSPNQRQSDFQIFWHSTCEYRQFRKTFFRIKWWKWQILRASYYLFTFFLFLKTKRKRAQLTYLRHALWVRLQWQKFHKLAATKPKTHLISA